jgi:hypothetical protein
MKPPFIHYGHTGQHLFRLIPSLVFPQFFYPGTCSRRGFNRMEDTTLGMHFSPNVARNSSKRIKALLSTCTVHCIAHFSGSCISWVYGHQPASVWNSWFEGEQLDDLFKNGINESTRDHLKILLTPKKKNTFRLGRGLTFSRWHVRLENLFVIKWQKYDDARRPGLPFSSWKNNLFLFHPPLHHLYWKNQCI